MFARHVSHEIVAHIDGEVTPPRAQQVELHLAQCAHCRAERDQVRFGIETLEHLQPVEAPDALWVSIEAGLLEQRSRKKLAVLQWRLALAATATLALLGSVYWAFAHHPGPRWDVVRIEGSPTVDAQPIHDAGKISAGQWIETNSGSSATVKVGQIGSVEVAPNTRLRVVASRPDEHRLALARGQIHAKISAPPRLFFVDTPSGIAVDLGCEYTLNADEAGFGLLQVTRGWVSFEWQGLESLVPAGASCRTLPHAGPGIPYFDDASEAMKRALESLGSEKTGTVSLVVILSEARVRDTLTLWHLLSRVEVADRPRVYDRIASLTPVPAGISREKALALDAETLRRWKDELAWTW